MRNRTHGFTLIELLVVISIIGLLSSVVLASLDSARSKARDAQRIRDIDQIMTALELYYADNGHYPYSSGGCGATSPNGAWCNSVQSQDANGNWIRHLGAPALAEYFPDGDPISPGQDGTLNFANNSKAYFYYSSGYGGSGQWYMFVTAFENPNQQIHQIDRVTSCPYSGYPNGYTFIYGPQEYVVTIGRNCQL